MYVYPSYLCGNKRGIIKKENRGQYPSTIGGLWSLIQL